jgi:hypothetical protein
MNGKKRFFSFPGFFVLAIWIAVEILTLSNILIGWNDFLGKSPIAMLFAQIFTVLLCAANYIDAVVNLVVPNRPGGRITGTWLLSALISLVVLAWGLQVHYPVFHSDLWLSLFVAGTAIVLRGIISWMLSLAASLCHSVPGTKQTKCI